MFIAVLTGFSWFALCIQFSACLTWTKYPDSVTPVWNGTTVALKWNYSLTTVEHNAANTAINRVWDRGNESHLEFIASKNFISGQSVAYAEDFAPHITISRSEEATLIINEVAKEDEGVYKFTVRFLTLGDRRISHNFSLEVRVQPTLQCPKNVSVKQGEQAIISCNVITGDPRPNITWTKDLHVISHSLTVVIDNVSISDGGTYDVTANNGRTIRVQVELDILFAPQMTNLAIESNPKNTTVLMNSTLILLCDTNANPPALYHLYFNDSYIGNSSSGEFNITVECDGVYTCVPINRIGTGSNGTLNIIAVVRPSVEISNKTVTAVEGDRLNFTCTASGKPKPKIAWTKVGHAIVIADTPLVPVVVDRPETADNTIQYQCTASNGVETPATATVNVTVYYKPSSTTSSKTIDVEEGGVASIPCVEVIGNPPAAISWYRGNATSADNITNRLDLNIKNAAENDIGWYTCFAKNVAGNATVKVLVRVVPRTTPPTVPTTTLAPCPKTPSKNELLLRALIDANCSEWLQVATEFAHTSCGLLRNFNCEHGRSCNSSCGGVVVYFILKFSQPIRGDLVVKTLKEEAKLKKFGRLRVAHESMIQIRSSSTASPSEENELLLRALIDANCSERLQVATEFANTSCGLLRNFNCEHGRSLNSSCRGGVEDFLLRFEQPIKGNLVVEFLNEEAWLKKFGRLKVVYQSIIETPSPTTSSASPTKESCLDSFFKDETCELKWLHIGLLIGFFIGLIVGICLIVWCKYGPTEGAPCCICRRRNCDKCPNRSVSPTQPFSSNHSIPSEGSPQADENSGYHKLGPLLAVDVVVVGQEQETVAGKAIPTYSTVEKSKENGKKKDRKAAEQKPTEGPMTKGETENQTTKVDFIGEEAIPTYAAVDKSKKKNKKKEHKPTEDQYAVVDKSKKKKKKNEPDATYAEVDMSKKSIKKQKPGEVLYADLGEFHQMQRMPEVSTSPKTLPPVKRPEAYAETQYADITQFLRGSPGDTGAEPPKDSTTLAVSNSATGSKEESSAGNAGDVEEATNETGF